MRPVKKRKTLEGKRHPQCLICCDNIQVFHKLRESQHVGKILTDLFRTFCKQMTWDNIKSKQNFKFSSECFPFCSSCKLNLVRIYKLDEQIENILKRVKRVTVNLSAKIIETEKGKRSIWTDRSLTTHTVTDPLDEGEKKRCYQNKIRYYRDITCRRFCPFVRLTEAELQKQNDVQSIRTLREDSGEAKNSFGEGSQSASSTFISCLICCEYVELYDYPSKSSSVAKILSNLFHVFCNYMQWETKRRYLLNFKFESFPFCKNCRKRLVRIYKLDENFQIVFREIKNIARAIYFKICESEESELYRSSSGIHKKGKIKLLYNAEKVQYYRSLAWQRESSIQLQEKYSLTDSENEVKSDYVPSSASEDASASSDSESFSSGSDFEEVEKKKNSRRNKIRKTLLSSQRYGHTISAADGKSSVAASSKKSRGKKYKIIQVRNDKYEYGGHYFKKFCTYTLKCAWCPYSTSTAYFTNMTEHVLYKHLPLFTYNSSTGVTVRPTCNWLENGYITVITGCVFRCYHCTFSSKSQSLICRHLRTKHFEHEKIQTGSSTPVTVVSDVPVNLTLEKRSNVGSNPVPVLPKYAKPEDMSLNQGVDHFEISKIALTEKVPLNTNESPECIYLD